MPTWRTSLGRAVTPGKVPTIGQARELPIAILETHAIPWRHDLAIRATGEPQPVDLAVATPLIPETNFALFTSRSPVSSLGPPAEEADGRGGEMALSVDLALDQVWEKEKAAALPDAWEWILPLIKPPAVGYSPAPQLGNHRLRPYQVEGVRQIALGRGMLLADDLGLGKTVQAATAVYSLIQRGLARRALIVCSPTSLRHWFAHVHSWAPELLVRMVSGTPANTSAAWGPQAHVYLTDHTSLIAALQGGAPSDAGLSIDIVVLDDLVHAQRLGDELWAALDRLQAPRRLALTGAPPGSEEFWLSLFDFLFPQPGLSEGGGGLMTPQVGPSPISILRRTRSEVVGQVPGATRIELWVDLEGEQRRVYQESIAEERRRLAGLGDTASPEHIRAAVARLLHAASYGPKTEEATKLRLVLDLIDEIASAGSKAFVVVNDEKERLGPVARALEPFGLATLDVIEGEAQGQGLNPVERLRTDPEMHVLLGAVDSSDGLPPMPELGYIIHLDPHWNPAIRGGLEERLRPGASTKAPLFVFEIWAAATLEARLHDFILERARFTGGVTAETAELSRDEWLESVIELGKASTASGEPLRWTSDAEKPAEVLPDKKLIIGMDPGRLAEGVTEFIHALGFPEIEQLFGNSQIGVDLLAWREAEGRIERILVRCLSEEGNVGVADARSALDLLDEHPDISRAYLVGTGDFSAAAKKAAEESDGRLELITGSELARHLRLLGKLADDREE
jgi:hypothetical protein